MYHNVGSNIHVFVDWNARTSFPRTGTIEMWQSG